MKSIRKIFSRLASSFSEIKSQIAFYPALLTMGGFFFSFLMKLVESTGISQTMIETLPPLGMESGDTARTILSVCIGSLISMMVFSFSMVMMILNQASSNYSPRLLPGLISDKRHQIILGLYMGTIMYNIFTLFSVDSSDQEYSLPGLSILLGIGLTIFCLTLFIYFIHNISQSIQINNILDRIFDVAYDRLQFLISSEREATIPENFPDTSDWFQYQPKKSGYFQNILINNTMGIAAKLKSRIYITQPKGFYISRSMVLIKSELELDEDAVEGFFSNINFSRGELIETNYVLAFKQITEIAVKAMSPGINDPGTALNAIDYLSDLFALRMKKLDRDLYGMEGTTWLKLASVSFSDLMYYSMASLRTYCCGDPILVQRLRLMFDHLGNEKAADDRYYAVLTRERDALIAQANATIISALDLEKINIMDSLTSDEKPDHTF